MSTGIQYLKENISQLPLDVQEAIVNTDYLEALHQIQDTNKLHIDQGEEIEDLTIKLMLGQIDQKDFANAVADRLRVDSMKARDITAQVNTLVMNPIRKELENMEYTLDDEETAPPIIPEGTLPPVHLEHEEDHHSLSSADILAGIEDPEPSKGTIHATTIPQSPLSSSQHSQQTPSSIAVGIPHPTPITPESAQTPASQPLSTTASILASANSTSPMQSPTTLRTSGAGSALAQNIEKPVISKPQEIKTSIDPYRESF